MFYFGTGGGIRTPINGFGDRYSTLELRPFVNKNQQHLIRRYWLILFYIIKLQSQLPDLHLLFYHLHG
jgi:hypothetical protein